MITSILGVLFQGNGLLEGTNLGKYDEKCIVEA